jgi:hypothetical protein
MDEKFLLLLKDPGIFPFLMRIDEELAQREQAKGCSRCGSRDFHCGDYPRKPRGCPERFLEAFSTRLSVCCANCRKRLTPPSVRFLGQRVYIGPALALVSPRGSCSANGLSRDLGVPGRTVQRWRVWWRRQFRSTPFWQMRRARFVEISEEELPTSMLERFQADSHLQQLLLFLRFLSPLSSRVSYA